MSASPSRGLPAALQKAWSGKPQRSGLTTDAILAAALSIADQNGVPSLTLRMLGVALGTSAMALYRHVQSRDELLLLTFDFALGKPELQPSTVPWDVGLASWAHALYGRYVAHPSLVDLPIRGLPTTPNHAAWIEQLLVVSETSGLTPLKRLEIGLLLDGHVRNIAGLRYSVVADAETQRLRASQVFAVMPADRFPKLRSVLTVGSLQSGEPPAIDFGVGIILHGAETSARSCARSSRID